MKRSAVLLAVLSYASPAFAETSTSTTSQTSTTTTTERFYYFNPDGKGAHAYYTPISMIVEGGFSPFFNRRLDQFNFAGGVKNLWLSIRNPFRTVNDYGWGRFLENEVLPNPAKETGQWVPNWTWHLIGGGFRTRLLKEYYIYHGSEYPTLNAWLVAYTSHLINELIQAERYASGAVDAVADLFFFDWVGKLIFEIDAVNEFATEVLHLTDWTTQTQWNPFSNTLINIGQLYWVRFHIWGPISVSAITGELTNTVGGTFDLPDGHQLSLGFGFKPHDIIVNNKGDAVADTLRLTFGLYISKNDNPVVVATYESTAAFARADVDGSVLSEERDTFVLNLYPGWFDIDGFEPGLTLAVHEGAVILAISHGSWPAGFGLGSQVFYSPADRRH